MPVLIRIIVAVLFLCMFLWAVSISHAATCFTSPNEVKRNVPGAHPMYTLRMKSHHGRCWFAGERKVMRVAAELRRSPAVIDERPLADVRLPGAVPLPRPRCDRICEAFQFYRDQMGWDDNMLTAIWPEMVIPR